MPKKDLAWLLGDNLEGLGILPVKSVSVYMKPWAPMLTMESVVGVLGHIVSA